MNETGTPKPMGDEKMLDAAHAHVDGDIKVHTKNVDVFYGDTHAIKDVSVDIEDKAVTAFIEARRFSSSPMVPKRLSTRSSWLRLSAVSPLVPFKLPMCSRFSARYSRRERASCRASCTWLSRWMAPRAWAMVCASARAAVRTLTW